MSDPQMTALATRVFECVTSYCNDSDLNNGEVVMAHIVAAHVLMTVCELDFKRQISLLRACVNVLEKQEPVQVLRLDATDLVEPLVPPQAN